VQSQQSGQRPHSSQAHSAQSGVRQLGQDVRAGAPQTQASGIVKTSSHRLGERRS